MLEFVQVSKRFKRTGPPALDAVSFSVAKGKICGLLGHNGAGKSTALGVMLGMVYPDAGEAIINGYSVQRERAKAIAKVGSIFEAPAFYEYLSGWRNLKVLTSYSGGVSEALLRETVELVGLTNRIRDRVGTYSHGMRQLLALAQALLPRPELLLLDEPTDGLDPEGIVEFRKQLLDLRNQLGLTVLFNSHLLSEVEQICDEVVILQGGKKVYEGSVHQVGEGKMNYRIEAENPEKLLAQCRNLGAEVHGDYFTFPIETKAADLLESLVQGGVRITRFSPEEGSLEALYLEFSQDQKGGKQST